MTSVAIFLFKLRSTPSLASIAFIVLATVMVASKVYSPQYVLWLTPLAVIALTTSKDLHAFWVWQAGETIYHVAIWQYLALFTGAHFGLPAGGYAWLTIARIATTLYLIWAVGKRALRARNPQESRSDLRLRPLSPTLSPLEPASDVGTREALTLLSRKYRGRLSPEEVGLTYASL